MVELTVVADEDGVLLELRDGADVHQLVARHDRRRPVRRLQLVRVEPVVDGMILPIYVANKVSNNVAK
jgi:hypothetical protein